MKTHYVYKITNTKPIDERKYYIGVHSDKNSDSLSDGYMGSSKYLDEAMKDIGVEYFTKEILSTWDTREEASAEEIRLHKLIDVAGSNDYYNKHNACEEGFYTVGKVAAINIETGLVEQVTTDELKINPNLKHNTYGQVTVEDVRTGKFKNVSKEEYQSNTHYRLHSEGFVNCVDIITGITKKVAKAEFDSNENLQNPMRGKLPVIDIRTNTKINVTKEEYKKCDYYVSLTSAAPVAVLNIKTKETFLVDKEEYLSNNDLVSPLAKFKITVFNPNGENMGYFIGMKLFNAKADFSTLKIANIFKSARNKTPMFLKSKNHEFKNWYAIRETFCIK